jgi:hypothetical protein
MPTNDFADSPDPYPSRCYHEAGHAVVSVHRGLKLFYVTMDPPANSGHFGETATKPVVMDLAQLEIAMQVATAGDVAEIWLLANREAEREKLTDDSLVKRFRRDARAAREPDPGIWNRDRLIFAERGLERDKEIRRTEAKAATEPEGWLPVFREAEKLVCDELWPGVEAVAEELRRSITLSHKQVAALVRTALDRTEP